MNPSGVGLLNWPQIVQAADSSGSFANRRFALAHAALERRPKFADFLGGFAGGMKFGDAEAEPRGFLIVDAGADQRIEQAAHGFQRFDTLFDTGALLGRRALVKQEGVFLAQAAQLLAGRLARP